MGKTIVGFKENVLISIQNHVFHLTATMDTGNAGIVPTLSVDTMIFGEQKIKFILNGHSFLVDNQGESTTLVGNVITKRPIIEIDFIKIKDKCFNNFKIAITDQRKNSTNMLINRNTMTQMEFIVDPSISYTDVNNHI